MQYIWLSLTFIPAMMNIYYMNGRKKHYKIDFVRDLLIRTGTY